MKKQIMILLILATVITACSKFGEGGTNAAQYVREQMSPIMKYDESIEPTDVMVVGIVDFDSRLAEINKMRRDAENGKVSLNELSDFFGRLDKERKAAKDLWFANPEDDRKAIEEGIVSFRKVYTVTITMFSQKKTKVKVIMDNDSITPWLLDCEYEENFFEYDSILGGSMKEILDKMDSLEIGD